MEGSISLRACRLTGLLLCGLFIGAQGAAVKNCTVKPVSIPFTDVNVLFAPDKFAAHRSMAWHAGSQSVSLGMQVGTTLNSTFMPEAKVCTDTIDRGCVFWRGGIFQTNKSESWIRDDGTVPYNASRKNQGWDFLNADQYHGTDPISKFPRGWDDFEVKVTGGELDLDGYPMVAIDNGTFPFGQGMVGLASDSSFLEVVVEKHQSPSRSWALDYGLTSKNKHLPGELVIGGYNKAKAGPNDFTTYKVFPDKTTPCPLQVEVTGLTWGNADLMENQSAFLACIEPAYWTTVMPITVRRNFNRTMLTGGNVSFVSSDWEYIKYNNSDPSLLPQGDFKITLRGGFEVTIPREEWIFPSTTVNHAIGQWDEIPDQIQTTIGNAGFNETTEPKIPFLGAPFLSQVYLRVDYENSVFGIAKTIRYGAAGDPDPELETLGCDDYLGPVVDSTDPPVAVDEPKKSNTGVIAGATVGGVVGLVLIAGAALCFFRRRKNKQNASGAAMAAMAQGTDQSKEQSEVQMMGFNQHPYDAPPAFSPTATPHPYSPTTSPGPYNNQNLSAIPARRPLPGQYMQGGPSPQDYYDNTQYSQRIPSMTSEPVELRGSDITSELSGRPRSQNYSGVFAEGNFDETSTVQGSHSGKN